jgi:hypothetical protein
MQDLLICLLIELRSSSSSSLSEFGSVSAATLVTSVGDDEVDYEGLDRPVNL